MDAFFPIRFPFYGILHHKANSFVFSLIFHNLGNWFPETSYKTHCMRRAWEIGTHTFPIVLVLFFPLVSHSMVYFIICEIHGFPHQFPIACENAVKFIELGEPRKLVPIFFLTHGYFSSIRFPFYGILCYHRGNVKSTLRALWLFFHSITFSTCSKIYWFLKRKNKKTR